MVPAFAQETPFVTVEIPEDRYIHGEVIVVSGKVKSIISDTPIIIRVAHNAGNIVDVAQITPAQDGSFTHTIQTRGPLWEKDGVHTISVSYGEENNAEVDFEYLTEKSREPVEKIYEVQVPEDSSTVDIEYAISGGIIKDMIFDNTRFSLIVMVDAQNDGTLTIELPRESIDARTNGCGGEDDVYITLIDGIEVPYQQIDDDNTRRTIAIEFEEEDSDIEIIGTCVVPEFGTVAVMILAVSIISIIALSRKSSLRI